jgi:hypothetical protein
LVSVGFWPSRVAKNQHAVVLQQGARRRLECHNPNFNQLRQLAVTFLPKKKGGESRPPEPVTFHPLNVMHQTSTIRGLRQPTALLLLLLVGSIALTWGLRAVGQDAPPAVPTNVVPFQRLREGTQLANQLGTFKPTGERIMFLAATGKGRFLCLENLNLERIGRLVRDNPENLQWEISGTLTEYGGANYLEVSRAILRSKTRSRKDAP